ncbi:BolA family transcriptional regulator [Sulfuriferula plumbiphila]|uniref:BolA family transcriptional regulator n=1 Tax=Sulfuriferula plumbiphila TaxID=171865 RepID=A0A512LB25_9PROT|nr:BolA family protein [Sulfuriferula plumbiphila]BBP04306.1 BolA family transcriptional regulator [Sulfuriferula plumbiphila]GEP31690.1 BolA family transcriptional regulator [Sulfuriferula plumbiphila]
MNVIELMRDRLALLQVEHLDIEDESAQHAGHAGARSGGGHYRLHIVSAAFKGKTTLARHRMVYDALGELMHHQIHALSITAHTPEEL